MTETVRNKYLLCNQCVNKVGRETKQKVLANVKRSFHEYEDSKTEKHVGFIKITQFVQEIERK